MKLRKCLFAILKLWKTWKYLFAIHEIWKHEHFCLYYMNYENICCITLIMKKIKMFVRNTWIMKYPFETHELWKKLNICCQYMNYEIFV